MPTYAYACADCGHAFDAVQSFSDDALTQCPECGGTLRKKFGSVGVVFKGGGFYRNDSRAANGSSSGSSSSSSATSSSTSSESTSSSSDSSSTSSTSSSSASSTGTSSTSTSSTPSA
ncbi:FmdB family transcriptional regulator [Xanthomonas oryzae pv. oryzae]|nr:FmdB family transcriptional regulator [Janibacter melonis]OLK75256.1 FmdB family transcriptional regulator [Xanthomonas oryzae pv. oryzae]